MKKDICMIPDSNGLVTFLVRGARDSDALLLLQRLYVLLLSDTSTGYRDGDSEAALGNSLKGGNIPPVGLLNSRLALTCASVLNLIDADDRAKIASFTGTGDADGNMTFTLVLKDGTEASGTLNYV